MEVKEKLESEVNSSISAEVTHILCGQCKGGAGVFSQPREVYSHCDYNLEGAGFSSACHKVLRL